jgi:hypothetical protein
MSNADLMERAREGVAELEMDEAGATSTLPALIERARADMVPAEISQLDVIASRMARSLTVSPAIRDNVEACWAVAYQAAWWSRSGTPFDPFAVGSKAYTTPDKGGALRLSYEAQLVNAVMLALVPMDRMPRYNFSGAGAQRYCQMLVWPTGEREPIPLVTPTFAQIKIKNSPLWFSDPDQQFCYYAGRAMARRHFPHALMGVYSRDEMPMLAVQERADYDPWAAAPPAEFQPSGGDGKPAEPDDIAELRTWLAGEQTRLMAMGEPDPLAKEFASLVGDERWGRLKAYEQTIVTAAGKAINGRIRELRQGAQ